MEILICDPYGDEFSRVYRLVSSDIASGIFEYWPNMARSLRFASWRSPQESRYLNKVLYSARPVFIPPENEGCVAVTLIN